MKSTTRTSLLPWQRRVVAVAWITYAAYYLGRVNISTVMLTLQPDLLVVSSITWMMIGAVAYAAVSLLLTTMPLALGGREEASSTAGLIDFSHSIGSGLSGGMIGAILDTQSWNAVFVALAGASLLAAIFSLAAVRDSRPLRT
jgi:sugar phosphate permease